MRIALPRLTSRRYRRVFIACVATLGISMCLGGLLLVVRWQTHRAVEDDTSLVLQQAGQQLTRSIQSRRGTLTLIRDTFAKAPDLSVADQSAMAQSAVSHTRHLLGLGLVRKQAPVVWWIEPPTASRRDLEDLEDAIMRRTTIGNAWRTPSTFTVLTSSNRSLLMMLEPLRQGGALVGVFDVRPLIADFFNLTLQQPYPVRLLEGELLLYRSPHWKEQTPDEDERIIQRRLAMDALRWTLQIQPGKTQMVKTISSFQALLVVFSFLVGLSSIGLIWLLAMRTWILERTISRRTSALRRTTERLRQLAITDELTGLYNRRFFYDRWQWEYRRAHRYGRPLGCLMIDVNGFKRINDRLGHYAGDQVLKQVAQELQTHLRQSDLLARFGGDEFIVALPETPLEQATTVAEKLRELQIRGAWTDPRLGPVSLSVGLSHLKGDESADQVLQNADSDLYLSKQSRQSRDAAEPLGARS